MHGRRRDEYKARLEDPKIVTGLARKAQQWDTLMTQLLDKELLRPQSLQLTEKLLLVNPDPLILWNKRRQCLLEDVTWELQPELVLTAACLERNPKAYGAWFHRKWCLVRDHDDDILKKELELCTLFLKMDERNFHCWNYRRFVVGLLIHGERLDGSWQHHSDNNKETAIMGAQIVITSVSGEEKRNMASKSSRDDIVEAEWEFTSQKIQENFSNYSAFHYRSKLITMKERTDSLLNEELELVHNAIFTEPDDQTAWWYFRFLLATMEPSKDMLQQEFELLMELNEAEKRQSKWTWLGLHVVLQQLMKTDAATPTVQAQIDECLDHLIQLDPDRSERYASMKQA